MRALLLLALAGCTRQVSTTWGGPANAVRIATFNTSLYREADGQLITDLSDRRHEPARRAAAILQELRPDIVLLQEFDYDEDGTAIELFLSQFLGVRQNRREPLTYPYVFHAPVNTGVPSGVDLDGDGRSDHPPGSREYGADCLGYGVHPGQYGMVILSRFPLGDARTFRTMLWRDVPYAALPDNPDTPEPGDYYSTEALAVLPLSSKSHWDVTATLPNGNALHLLAAHPTPPTFDGPEDRNGARNHDEIRFWTNYLSNTDWIVDDAGGTGGLHPDASFVLLGDHNSDPHDGDSRRDAIRTLLSHPRANDAHPRGLGGSEQAVLQAGTNAWHKGPPAEDTADFPDTNEAGNAPGNLRVDYALPSKDLDLVGAGVFWPLSTDKSFQLIGTWPFPLTDHRPVWVDVEL